MKKKTLILLFIGIFVAGAFLLTYNFFVKEEKPTVYIAIVGPMSGKYKENGEEMLRGARLSLDEVRHTIKDKNIELLVFNDNGKRAAIKIASQIADEKKVLLVIGHYDSIGSVVAGKIYKKSGIPAITASAIAEEGISDNDWYFRIIAKSGFIKSFILNYMKKELNGSKSIIINDKNEYGASLTSGIKEECEKLGIEIQNRWEFDSNERDPTSELYKIVGILWSKANPGTIFCAAHEAHSAEIFGYTRYAGTNYTVIGADSFATPSFIKQFDNYPLEKKTPGYFSNGIYGTAPFISYMADTEHARSFRQAFINKYNKEPSWIAAGYHDAIQLAVEGIEKSEIQFNNIQEDRRRVRDSLSRLNNYDVAINGISGNIFFDKNNNLAEQSLMVGIWDNHVFLPAYSQYRFVSPVKENTEQIPDSIIIEQQMFKKFKVVYAGIDINNIRSLNIKNGTYSIDFYLWFRFQGEFDDSNIRFINAVNPVVLGKPMFQETSDDNVTTRTYRVVADFKEELNEQSAYPLDIHTLSIKFRHQNLSRAELLYVPDLPGLRAVDAEKKLLIGAGLGWDVNSVSCDQNIVKASGKDKEMISYSQLCSDIQIQRKYLSSIFLKLFFPMLVIASLLYMVYFISPIKQHKISPLFILSALLISGIMHYIYQSYKLFCYGIFTMYILSGIATVISVFIYLMRQRHTEKKVRAILWIGKIISPLFLLAYVLFIIYGRSWFHLI